MFFRFKSAAHTAIGMGINTYLHPNFDKICSESSRFVVNLCF